MLRVLLVDDDEDLLFIVGEYLESKGIEFHLANSAAQARKRLAHFHYDLVVSDFQMPGESGLDLFRSLSLRYPEIPFVLMSGNMDSRLRREALSMGVWNVLEKPFDLRQLRRFILESGRLAIGKEIGVPAA
jgi:two-component system, OmpR family, phosphate regulon response regulator OmpR